MLERQQAQLIAGVQGLHQMNQKGERVPAEPLEANGIGQPLVHQILQRLGVLDAGDPWDEIEPEISEAESRTAEPDPASDPMSPPESQYLWPSVSNAGSNVTLGGPIETTLMPSRGWGIPPAGNTTLSPLATTPSYPFLSADGSQSLRPTLPLATDVADGSIADSIPFGPIAMGESNMELFTQPYSNSIVPDPGRFSYSTMDQCASSSSGRPFGGENIAVLNGTGTGHSFYM
ncbi:MAG: hypothetical protein Q9196_002936 [Gyalolechia fulgens]